MYLKLSFLSISLCQGWFFDQVSTCLAGSVIGALFVDGFVCQFVILKYLIQLIIHCVLSSSIVYFLFNQIDFDAPYKFLPWQWYCWDSVIQRYAMAFCYIMPILTVRVPDDFNYLRLKLSLSTKCFLLALPDSQHLIISEIGRI